MQRVVIDNLYVPEESKAEFLAAAQTIQAFLRTIPGYVEGYIYEKQSGENRYNFVTTAVWESQDALDKAQQMVTEENQKRGYNRQETAKRLGVEIVRAIYDRRPY